MRTARLALIGAVACAMQTAALAAGPDTSPAGTSASDDDRKLICRKTLETGSLVKKNKQCFTKAEWDKIYAAHREGNTKLIDGLSGRCGQNGGEGCNI